MLRVKNLSCGYDRLEVLKNITFTVGSNENLCILGPNGCGKTTLLRAVAGLIPSSGEIYIGDMDVKKSTRKKVSRKIALMNQITSVYFSYTVYEAVMLGRYSLMKDSLFKTESKNDREFVLVCLEKTGIIDLKDRFITELSGGQLQRVFLARVFAQDPEIVLLDEPTNHLDLKYQIELVEYLKAWSKSNNRCVIGVLHDINLALSFADRILLMDNGRISSDEDVSSFDLDLISQIYRTDVRSYMLDSLKKWER